MPPHCDSMDGPVVKAAERALEARNVTLVLPFVPGESEGEVEGAFDLVMEARKACGASQQVADRYFFETVVRVHRAGEGAPFTGLKPAGLDVGPVIPVAERALETCSARELEDVLSHAVRTEVQRRFDSVLRLKAHAKESVEAAREYTHALLGLQGYAAQLYEFIKTGPDGEHGDRH